MHMAHNVKAAHASVALRYAQAGYPVLLVFPIRDGACACPKGAKCPTPGKHPIDKAWTKKATLEPARIKALFARWPDAHIGIMPPEGCSIVDVDPRNGGNETMRTLLNGAKLPSTPTQRSGGGGLHLVFSGAPAGPLGKGVDVKRHGRGYVVAYPAGHASGGEYAWIKAPWQVKPAPLPAPLQGEHSKPVDDFDTPAPDTRPATPLATVREALSHIPAEDYHRWINIGQALCHTYGDDGQAVWEEWSRTSPKWREGDENKWDTFDKNRDRPLITVRSIMSIARRSGYRPLVTEFSASLWASGDITGLSNTTPEPLDWVLEPCVPAGKVTLLSGAGGSSKSFLALILSMQLALGDEWGMFKPTKAGRALLLVAEEDRADIHRRIHTVCTARLYNDEQLAQIERNVSVLSVRGMDWRLVWHDETGDLQETDRVDYLIEEVRACGARLLVLDPLVAFNGANENDNMEMSRLMLTLDRIASATGAAVVVLHHVSKGGQVTSLNDATQAVVRGASALVDNARATLLLTRLPRADAPLYGVREDDAGRFIVARVVKNNYGPHVADQIYAVEGGGALRLAPEVQRMHANAKEAEKAQRDEDEPLRVLRALHAQPAAHTRQLATATGISHRTVARHVATLIEEGLVERQGVGWSTQHTITAAGIQQLGTDDALADIL